MTERLLELGNNVIATDMNYNGLEELAKKMSSHSERLLILKLDVTKPQEWEQVYATAVSKFNQIDVHLNIAGYLKPAYLLDISPTDVNIHFDVNVKGLIYGTQFAARHMKEKKSGQIVNISSIAAYSPYPGCSLYGISILLFQSIKCLIKLTILFYVIRSFKGCSSFIYFIYFKGNRTF